MSNSIQWFIPSSEVPALLSQLGLSSVVPDLLIHVASQARHGARPLISKFHVGVAGMTSSGNIYCGANVEFPPHQLNTCIHAEQFLIGNMLQHGESDLIHFASDISPCGHCRQFLRELPTADALTIWMAQPPGKEPLKYSLDDLLPYAFSPASLNVHSRISAVPDPEVAPLKWVHDNIHLQVKENPTLISNSSSTTTSTPSTSSSSTSSSSMTSITRLSPPPLPSPVVVDFSAMLHSVDPEYSPAFTRLIQLSPPQDSLLPLWASLHAAALQAVNLSYNPYSSSPCGIALATRCGRIFSGFYLENAAYTPSLAPLQSAIVGLVMAGLSLGDVALVVVAEKAESPTISHLFVTKLILSSWAPDAQIIYRTVE